MLCTTQQKGSLFFNLLWYVYGTFTQSSAVNGTRTRIIENTIGHNSRYSEKVLYHIMEPNDLGPSLDSGTALCKCTIAPAESESKGKIDVIGLDLCRESTVSSVLDWDCRFFVHVHSSSDFVICKSCPQTIWLSVSLDDAAHQPQAVVATPAAEPATEENYYEEPPADSPTEDQREKSPFKDEGTIFLNKGQCARALYDYQAGAQLNCIFQMLRPIQTERKRKR